jgi:NAD(P)-dependent dehydrogenase (short-subunit alcohol dehydrogenase family)
MTVALDKKGPALVTGASSGIGREFAQQIAAAILARTGSISEFRVAKAALGSSARIKITRESSGFVPLLRP